MKRIFLLAITIIFLLSSISRAEEEFRYVGVDDNLVYIGIDNYGAKWYLDTTTLNSYSPNDKTINISIVTYSLSPYKQIIINIYTELTKDVKKSNKLFASTRKISQQCIIDFINNQWCTTNILLYDHMNDLIYNKVLDVTFNNWYPIANAKQLKNIISWIREHYYSPPKNENSSAKKGSLLDTINERRASKRLPPIQSIEEPKPQIEDESKTSFLIALFFITIIAIWRMCIPTQQKNEVLPLNSQNKNDWKNKTENEEVDYIDAVIIEDNDKRTFSRPIYNNEKADNKNINNVDSFMSHITKLEKIMLILLCISITFSLLTLMGILTPLEYMPLSTVRDAFLSSFLWVCAWFSVRYSFYYTNNSSKIGKNITAIFIRCIGISICLFIVWAYEMYKIRNG